MVRIDADVSGIDDFLDDGGGAGVDSFGPGYDAAFTIVPVLVVGGFVLVIVLVVVNFLRLRKKGISPLASEAEVMADAVRSASVRTSGAQPAQSTAPPAKTPEARLEEIERLYTAGTITAAERDTARAAVLGSL